MKNVDHNFPEPHVTSLKLLGFFQQIVQNPNIFSLQ